MDEQISPSTISIKVSDEGRDDDFQSANACANEGKLDGSKVKIFTPNESYRIWERFLVLSSLKRAGDTDTLTEAIDRLETTWHKEDVPTSGDSRNAFTKFTQ